MKNYSTNGGYQSVDLRIVSGMYMWINKYGWAAMGLTKPFAVHPFAY